MKLGFPIPNCREGRDILPGDISPQALIDLAQECERRGFDSGWANDYVTTPASTARGFDQPPSWYESLLSLCAIAMKTERIKLGVAVIVMPFRTEWQYALNPVSQRKLSSLVMNNASRAASAISACTRESRSRVLGGPDGCRRINRRVRFHDVSWRGIPSFPSYAGGRRAIPRPGLAQSHEAGIDGGRHDAVL